MGLLSRRAPWKSRCWWPGCQVHGQVALPAVRYHTYQVRTSARPFLSLPVLPTRYRLTATSPLQVGDRAVSAPTPQSYSEAHGASSRNLFSSASRNNTKEPPRSNRTYPGRYCPLVISRADSLCVMQHMAGPDKAWTACHLGVCTVFATWHPTVGCSGWRSRR